MISPVHSLTRPARLGARGWNGLQWRTSSSSRACSPFPLLGVRSADHASTHSGVGFSAGVIASVILFRRAYPFLATTYNTVPTHSVAYPNSHRDIAFRTGMACRARHGLRCRHGLRRLRPLLQPRKNTGYAHHPPRRGQEGRRMNAAYTTSQRDP